MSPQVLTWIIAAVATAGVIIRPFGLPEAIWAVVGAVLLVLMSPTDALGKIGKGVDVYLFLAGMMLLAEIAREEGLFDFAAGLGGQARRRFLEPAVPSGLRRRRDRDHVSVEWLHAVDADARRRRCGERRKPTSASYLLICALSPTASFVLPMNKPIS